MEEEKKLNLKEKKKFADRDENNCLRQEKMVQIENKHF